MNALRVWLIHRLGGVDQPPKPPLTMPWTGTSNSFNAAPQSVIVRTTWPDYVPNPRRRRWWR